MNYICIWRFVWCVWNIIAKINWSWRAFFFVCTESTNENETDVGDDSAEAEDDADNDSKEATDADDDSKEGDNDEKDSNADDDDDDDQV